MKHARASAVVDGVGATIAGRLVQVMETWRFPVFALTLIAGLTLLMFAVLLIPAGETGMGAFAEDFKVWCFGYDPATGALDWNYVGMTLFIPLLLSGVIVMTWWEPLREGFRAHRRGLYAWSAGALALVACSAVAATTIDPAPSDEELPFPAEAIRTSRALPAFSLPSHSGRVLSSSELGGKVTLVTAIYASCNYTCPMIMAETKRAVAGLPAELVGDLRVVAITLDPEHDTPTSLAKLAEAQRLDSATYQLLAGDADEVNRLLDSLEIARTRDPETGVIDHANLFILVDRNGKIAYRLSLGPRQKQWLDSALRLLLSET